MTGSGARRALVVRGGWQGHQPVEATDLFIPFLRSHGFDVSVHDVASADDADDADDRTRAGVGPAVYADAEVMAGLDLVVQCNTMNTITGEQLSGLRAAVAAGTGLAGWHGGIADSYRNSSDYQQLVGGLFACHPGKEPSERVGEQSDNYVPHRIVVTDPSHPITEGIEDFELVTEQYWVLSDDYVDVLATTTQAVRAWDEWTRPVTSPAVWTRQWGAGRIFVATPGHRVEVLEHPSVRAIIERGLLWAAR